LGIEKEGLRGREVRKHRTVSILVQGREGEWDQGTKEGVNTLSGRRGTILTKRG